MTHSHHAATGSETVEIDQPAPVHVHIVGSDVALHAPSKVKDRHSTFRTYTVLPGVPAQILAHIPNRRRAVVTFVGQSTDVGYLCGSQGDATGQPNPSGSIIMGLQVIELQGTDEVWLACAASSPVGITVGVASEYEGV